MTAEQFAEDALNFERRTSFLAKSPDSAESFARYHGVMKHALIKAAEGLECPKLARISHLEPDQDLAAQPHKVLRARRNDPPSVGFFMPTASLLAHSVNLLTFLWGIEERKSAHGEAEPIRPFIYTFDEKNQEFDAAYSCAWPVRYIKADSLVGYWRALREASIADGLDAMVFVSVAQGMAFATSMGVAPKHIWWAHKWHGLDLPNLDGYIDACHPFHEGNIEIASRPWRSTYTALPEMFDTSKTAAAQELRAGMDVRTVFGWMGREDKLTPEYIAAVCEILTRVPDSIFVYTGRTEPEWVAGAFLKANVLDRTAYLGWVDTALWAQVIDVYLDTFPFQSGHSGYAMMAACKPVIWLHDDAVAQEQSASGLIKATWDSGASEIFPALPYARTVDEYLLAAAQFGLAPADARAQAGAFYRAWLERFMMDKQRMAQSVSRAILDVING